MTDEMRYQNIMLEALDTKFVAVNERLDYALEELAESRRCDDRQQVRMDQMQFAMQHEAQENAKRFAEQHKQLDEHTKQFAQQRKQLDEHTKQFAEHGKQLALHTKLLIEHGKRFDGIDKRFEAVDKRFDASDERFAAFQEQMSAFAARTDQTLATILQNTDISGGTAKKSAKPKRKKAH